MTEPTKSGAKPGPQRSGAARTRPMVTIYTATIAPPPRSPASMTVDEINAVFRAAGLGRAIGDGNRYNQFRACAFAEIVGSVKAGRSRNTVRRCRRALHRALRVRGVAWLSTATGAEA